MRRFFLLVSAAVGLFQPACISASSSSEGDDNGASTSAGANAGGTGGSAGSGVTAGLGGTNGAGTGAGGVAGAQAGTGATSGSGGSNAPGGTGAGGSSEAGSGGTAGSAGAPGGSGGTAGSALAGMAGASSGGTAGRGAGGMAGRGAGGAAGSTGIGGKGGSDSFDPCPATGACKILPLGDSITDGLVVPGGYRIELFHLALQGSKQITYVGGSMNGPTMVDGVAFPRSHEGHSGWTIAQIDGIVPTPALGPNPNIVLLHIGTNDMYQTPAGAPDRLGALIDQILTQLPSALLVVSNIIPLPSSTSAVMTYNAAVPGVVNARKNAGKHILFVDQFTGFPTSELQDGVHPNSTGYARMARAWYAAISAYLH